MEQSVQKRRHINFRRRLRLFSSKTFSRINTSTFIKPSSFYTPTCLWKWNRVFWNVGI